MPQVSQIFGHDTQLAETIGKCQSLHAKIKQTEPHLILSVVSQPKSFLSSYMISEQLMVGSFLVNGSLDNDTLLLNVGEYETSQLVIIVPTILCSLMCALIGETLSNAF